MCVHREICHTCLGTEPLLLKIFFQTLAQIIRIHFNVCMYYEMGTEIGILNMGQQLTFALL